MYDNAGADDDNCVTDDNDDNSVGLTDYLSIWLYTVVM